MNKIRSLILFSVGYVRPLASLETLAIWQRADEGNQVVKVVQRGDKFFVCECFLSSSDALYV